ncbi:MAG: nuclear transport factor 2 family protein [Novosphingobium sp.]
MDLLARLLDERAIERLILDYAAMLDAGDSEGLAACFAEHGRSNRPTDPEVFTEGRGALLAAFKARPPRKARHVFANICVDVDGDHATATSQVLLFTAADKPALVGSYADRLVRTAEGWRFAERRGSLDFPPA